MAAAEAHPRSPCPDSGLVLISGPSRSGKSRWAEHLAQHSARPVLYLATGPAPDGDHSWAERVSLHRSRRPPTWESQEVGSDLEASLRALQRPDHPHHHHLLLIDSLGSWLAWHLEDEPEPWSERCRALQALLHNHPQPILLVVEETGWGVVPPTAIGGLFRDRLGSLQQQLMLDCRQAWLVVAGRALDLLALGHPIPGD